VLTLLNLLHRLTEHADSKHKGKSLAECFPTFTGDKTK
jgi:hypothetical protein